MTYDSDSDFEDDCTETNVLLGYASKKASDDDTISSIGGTPTWLDPAKPPSAVLAKCKVCNDLLVLLLQLNGDLPELFPSHERRLYVFSCRRATCRKKEGCIRAIRGTRVAENWTKNNAKSTTAQRETEKGEEKTKKEPVVNIGETLFGAKPPSNSSTSNPFSTSASATPANPFSTNSLSSSSNPFASSGLPVSELAAKPPQAPSSPTTTTTATLPQTFASILTLNTSPATFGPSPPPEPWPSASSFPPPYPLYYLSEADYEVLDKAPEIPIPTQTMDLDESPSNSNSTPQKEDKEVFESTIDTTFQKFADRIAQNPEQVIRYEFRGQPLLFSKNDVVGRIFSTQANENVKVRTTSGGKGIPRCGNCGAGRVFEVQLMPHAIMELESEELGLDGMEWGTVVVGVCERDCVPRDVDDGQIGYVEEWAGVQWEEVK